MTHRPITLAVMLVGGLWGMDARAQWTGAGELIAVLPEIMQHAERPECAVYLNRFQRPLGEIEVWNSPLGEVQFKFFRGLGSEVDQVIVWEVPTGTAVLPFTHTLDEHDSDVFCIAVQTEGS